jgi:hypothetical protein
MYRPVFFIKATVPLAGPPRDWKKKRSTAVRHILRGQAGVARFKEFLN